MLMTWKGLRNEIHKSVTSRQTKGVDIPGLAARLPTTTAGTSGLPALLSLGLPLLLLGLESLSLMRFRLPSLISAPEPAPSPSLPDPAPVRARLLFSGLTVSRIIEPLRCGCGRATGCVPEETSAGSGAEEVGAGAGERGLEGGPLGVDMPVAGFERLYFFLCFLRDDSLPLASERLGEPGRLRDVEDTVRLRGSGCLAGRDEGVFVPLVEEPDGGWALALSDAAAFFSSASFLSCSSFKRSVSESDDSLCEMLARRTRLRYFTADL